MDEHEQETRELENHMERALAVAIAHGSSVIEAWAKLSAKRQAQREHPGLRTFDLEAPAAASTAVALRAREDLAAGRQDANFWRNAPISELLDRIRESGIEPTRLGDPTHDRYWAERAPGADAMSLYSYAQRYADQSAVAANVRDNIAGLLAEYGLDPDDMLAMSPRQAAEAYTQARAEHYAPDQHPTMTTDGTDATDRDGAQVARLVAEAQTADAEAVYAAGQAETATAAAGQAEVLHGDVVAGDRGPQQPSRAQQVRATSNSGAGRSAATAARDHPTNPRAATATAGKGPTARRSSGNTTDRERGRSM